ncbi:hypothetical protein [Halococcus sp. AFM35]|uniref:hypothetical protein n=1 Tax=Halococcus sp. AFM35 TaxID=3421653 RepID=UPI003EBEE954
MSNFYHSKYDYQLVLGDKQTISETLAFPDGSSPDLSNRSVEFVMRHVASGAKVVAAGATIDDAASGSVSFTLSSGQTGRAGLHRAEWIITGGDDDPTTLPVEEPVSIYIREDVENDGEAVAPLPDSLDGQTITPAQVGTDAERADVYGGVVQSQELSNIATHVCHDSQDLADALTAASNGEYVKAHLGDKTYTPADHITLPVDVSAGGIELHGYYPGRPNFSPDAYKPQRGTVIDAGGSTLLTGSDFSGFKMESVTVHNCTHAVEFGSSTELGVANASIKDVIISSNTDYALKFWNSQIDRLDNVLQYNGPALIHSIGTAISAGTDTTTSGFQPTNGTWIELHSSCDGSMSPIKLEAQTDSTFNNFVTMIRPQVISGSVANTDATAGIELIGGGANDAATQNHTIIAADIEGAWQHAVRTKNYVFNCAIGIAGTTGECEWDVYLESNTRNCDVTSQRPISVYSVATSNSIPNQTTNLGGNYSMGLTQNDSDPSRATLYTGVNAFAWELYDDRVRFGDGQVVQTTEAFRQNPKDLQGVTGGRGQFRMHDGSGTAPLGLAVWDDTNSQWVSQVDGTTFT